MQSLRVLTTLCVCLSVLALPNETWHSVQAQNLNNNQATLLLKQADFFIQSNQFLAAQTKLEEALRLYQASKDTGGQRETLIDLGIVYYRQGRNQRALEYLQQAETIPGNSSQRGRLLSSQALVYLELGNYYRALANFQQAQGTQLQDLSRENRNQIGLGEAYRYVGAYTQALQILELALRVPGERSDRAQALNAVGDVYFDLGQYEQSKDYYEQALALRLSTGDRFGVARVQNNLGRVYGELGKFSQSLEFYQQSLNLVNSLGDEVGKVNTLNNLGLIYIQTGDNDRALSYLQQALSNNNIGRVQTLNNLGYLYRKLGKYPQSKDYYEQALAWARKNGDRTGIAKALTGLGETFLKSGNIPQAIQSLQEGTSVFESLRPGLRDEQKVTIFETQAYAYGLLQTALVAKKDYAGALVASERGRARAFVELLAKRASPVATENEIAPLTIKQIQATAAHYQATLVSYSIIDDDLYIWVMNPKENLAFRRSKFPASDKNTNQQVVQLREKILTKKTSRKAVTAASQEAYKFLIEPIADLLPTDPQARVIFIPQSSLFLVPFPALQDSVGKYLIERHTISIAPSIQALSLLKVRSPVSTTKPNVLIVGNPYPLPVKLPPLPGAEAEAKAVAQLYNTTALTGSEPTETNIAAKMNKAQIVHLATHGFFDDRQGLASSLAFVASGDADGLLTAEEMLDMNLQANLVVLSACNTGRGKITGDGVIGLSRSLLSAGVSSVVVSLWAVPDLPTAALMSEFYRNLNKKPDKAQALRQAMLTTMKQTPSPRDWAGFVLIGVP